jgi:hypothetical protein
VDLVLIKEEVKEKVMLTLNKVRKSDDLLFLVFKFKRNVQKRERKRRIDPIM